MFLFIYAQKRSCADEQNIIQISLLIIVVDFMPAVTKLMAILNFTPDSFSDANEFFQLDKAIDRIKQLVEEKVHIIDIGAESTNPNSKAISAQEELERLEPVVKKAIELTRGTSTCISIDTYKTSVAEKMVSLGADIINCVCGKDDFMKMTDLCKTVFFTHALNVPEDRSVHIDENEDIIDFIFSWAETILENKNNECDVIIDPGIGFGKTASQSWEILRRIRELKLRLAAHGVRICVGHSRKSFLENRDRINSTLAISGYLASLEVDYIRIHDTKLHLDALKPLGLLG